MNAQELLKNRSPEVQQLILEAIARELDKRKRDNPLTFIPAQFQPKQAKFFDMVENSYAKWLALGGARGGAKSDSVRKIMLHRRLKYEGSNGVLFRRSLNDLQDNHITPLFQEFPHLRQYYNVQQKTLAIPTSKPDVFSYILFRHEEIEDKLVEMFQGKNYDDIAVDEATHNSERALIAMSQSCRTTRTDMKSKFMLTMNPGGRSHCVPFGDVLTLNGWKPIQDIVSGERIYSVEKNGSMVEKSVSRTFEYDYSGQMVSIKSRGLDIVCTPNHRVASVVGTKGNRGKKNFTLVEIQRLQGQATILRSVDYLGGFSGGVFTAPEVKVRAERRDKKKQPTTLTMSNYCKLLGWFLSEGCASSSSGQRFFCIAQEKPHYRIQIEKLLDDCGFRYYAGKSEYRINSPRWAAYFYQFGKCRQKFIPLWVKNLSKIHLYELFETMMNGDGHWVTGKSSGTYHTISKQLSDDFSEVCIKLGFIVKTTQSQQKERNGLRYTVRFKTVKSCGTEILTGNHIYNVSTKTKRKSDIKSEHFNGKVYCLGVDGTETFILRQNGSVWVSGNSYIKRLFIDKKYIQNEKKEDYEYLQAYGWDNGYWSINALAQDGLTLNDYHSWEENQRFDYFVTRTDYGKALNSLNDNDRKAHLFGDWYVFAGQFFSMWSEANIIKKPYNYKNSFPKAGAIDYGQHTVFTACDRDYDGNITFFAEDYTQHKTPTERASSLGRCLIDKELWNLPIDCDTDMQFSNEHYKGGDRAPIEIYRDVLKEMFKQEGFEGKEPILSIVSKKSIGNKNYRIATNEFFKDCLQKATIKFVESEMPICIQTIPELVYSKKDSTGLDFDDKIGFDHGFDSAKMAMMQVYVPIEVEKELAWITDWKKRTIETNGQWRPGMG